VIRWGGDETPADFWKALAVALLLVVAGYAFVLAAAAYFPVPQ